MSIARKAPGAAKFSSEELLGARSEETVGARSGTFAMWGRGGAGSRGGAIGQTSPSGDNDYAGLKVPRGGQVRVRVKVTRKYDLSASVLVKAYIDNYNLVQSKQTAVTARECGEYPFTSATSNIAGPVKPTDCGFEKDFSWVPTAELGSYANTFSGMTCYDAGRCYYNEVKTPLCAPEKWSYAVSQTNPPAECNVQRLDCGNLAAEPSLPDACKIPSERLVCGWQMLNSQLTTVNKVPSQCSNVVSRARQIECPESVYKPDANYGNPAECAAAQGFSRLSAQGAGSATNAKDYAATTEELKWVGAKELSGERNNPKRPSESWKKQWTHFVGAHGDCANPDEAVRCVNHESVTNNSPLYEKLDSTWKPDLSFFSVTSPGLGAPPAELFNPANFQITGPINLPIAQYERAEYHPSGKPRNALLEPTEENREAFRSLCPKWYPWGGSSEEVLRAELGSSVKSYEKLYQETNYSETISLTDEQVANLSLIETCTKITRVLDRTQTKVTIRDLGVSAETPLDCLAQNRAFPCTSEIEGEVEEAPPVLTVDTEKAIGLGKEELTRFDPTAGNNFGCTGPGCMNISINLNAGPRPNELADTTVTYNMPLTYPLNLFWGEDYLTVAHKKTEVVEVGVLGRAG